MQNRSFCLATSPTSVVAVEYYYILIIIIVVGPGAWLSHSAAEGYRFLSKVVATLARNAGPPSVVRGCCCFPPPKSSIPCNSAGLFHLNPLPLLCKIDIFGCLFPKSRNPCNSAGHFHFCISLRSWCAPQEVLSRP